MKNRVTIDFGIFYSILRVVKGIRKDLRTMQTGEVRKPVPKRKLRDAIYTEDVLRILKISPATLNNYEKKGLLKFHKEERRKVYSEAEVRAFRTSKGRRKRLTKNLIQRKFKD
jgi:hypothetical protein